MLQVSRACVVKGHEQKLIEFACVFPECNFNRFLCNKCLRIAWHKHQQQDQDHILDLKEMQDYIEKKIIQKQQGQEAANPQKQISEEILKQLKCVIGFIEIIKLMHFQDDQLLKESLVKLKNNGFDQIDNKDLNNLINIDQQVNKIHSQLLEETISIIQKLIKIQEWCYSQQIVNRGFKQNDIVLQQKIKDAKSQIIKYDQLEGDFQIYSSTISNDFKYVASGGTDQLLKIWNYNNNLLVKSIQLDGWISRITFTEDSKFLYVGKHQYLHQFDAGNQFKETFKQPIHQSAIQNIYCITNTIILTSSTDKTIIKTDINLKQQLLVIKAHDDRIDGLDYNINLNMIASSSNDRSIKIWNANNGQLFIDKQHAHNNNCNCIFQVLFIIKKNQLLSLDNLRNIITWNINFELKQMEQTQKITDVNQILNVSLVLDQQYITLVCQEYIKIYSIKGDYIRSINHDVKEFIMFNLIQLQSMRALIVKGKKTLQICKVDLD